MPVLAHQGFWFLRHGETDWNAANLAQGREDVPLNAAGRDQARQAALRLIGRGIAGISVSPLGRARETARIIGDALGLMPVVEDGLIEADFGSMEGQMMLAEWFSEWIAGTATPPGAESFAALQIRAAAGLNRCLARPAPHLVVAHGAFFRAIRGVMGLNPDFRTPNATPLLCEPPASEDAAWTLLPE